MPSANPWEQLVDHPPYVLDSDRLFVDTFNSGCQAGSRLLINLSHPPEVRLGPTSAPVYILQMNPSYDGAEQSGPRDRARMARDLENLRAPTAAHLGVVERDKWWTPRLKPLVEILGQDVVAKSICSIDFFPYRSLDFGHGFLRLPSQSYAFSLVHDAIHEGKLILVTRGFRLWCHSIPELFHLHGISVFQSCNPRSVSISPRSFTNGAFDRVVQTITNYKSLGLS